jgi:hypothetical protein
VWEIRGMELGGYGVWRKWIMKALCMVNPFRLLAECEAPLVVSCSCLFEGENGAESLGFGAGNSVICRNSIADFLELGDWYIPCSHYNPCILNFSNFIQFTLNHLFLFYYISSYRILINITSNWLFFFN